MAAPYTWSFGGTGGSVRRFGALTLPPVGSYDPVLDAQQRAAARGLVDLMGDTALSQSRSTQDLALQRKQLQQAKKRQIGNIDRQYNILGQNQTVAMRRLGVQDGGTPIQSRIVRDKNEQREVDEVKRVFRAQIQAARMAYQRATQDRQLAQARAQRENTFYDQDIDTAKWYQARSSGLL